MTRYVKRCETCAAHKVSQGKPVYKMVSHPKVDRSWEMIYMDLLGPLSRSKHGNFFFLVI